jgi:hypothetical protein
MAMRYIGKLPIQGDKPNPRIMFRALIAKTVKISGIKGISFDQNSRTENWAAPAKTKALICMAFAGSTPASIAEIPKVTPKGNTARATGKMAFAPVKTPLVENSTALEFDEIIIWYS